jgi:non-ribosomal peptide synthetase component E (peptide arylation enzyme)
MLLQPSPAGTGATGYNYPILALLLVGGTSVLLERWDGRHPEQVLALLEQHRCTGAVLIPTQLAKLVGVADIGRHDLSSLRYVTNAGARLPEVIAEAAESLLGCRIQTVYGATDGGVPSMTSIDDRRDKRLSTVGRVLRGEEMCLLAEDGTAVVPGQAGEICWRGANKSFGYLNDPQANLAVWDEQGRYHSGDMGELDADGYLRVVGRKKDMIIRGGRNINPG